MLGIRGTNFISAYNFQLNSVLRQGTCVIWISELVGARHQATIEFVKPNNMYLSCAYLNVCSVQCS